MILAKHTSLVFLSLIVLMMVVATAKGSSSSCIPEAERNHCNDKYSDNATSSSSALTAEQCKAKLARMICNLDAACKYCDQKYVQSSERISRNVLLHFHCEEHLKMDELVDRCPSHLLLYLILLTVLFAVSFVALVLYMFCCKAVEEDDDDEPGDLKQQQPKQKGGKSKKAGKSGIKGASSSSVVKSSKQSSVGVGGGGPLQSSSSGKPN